MPLLSRSTHLMSALEKSTQASSNSGEADGTKSFHFSRTAARIPPTGSARPSWMTDARLSVTDARLSVTDARLSVTDARLSVKDARLSVKDARLSVKDARLTLRRTPVIRDGCAPHAAARVPHVAAHVRPWDPPCPGLQRSGRCRREDMERRRGMSSARRELCSQTSHERPWLPVRSGTRVSRPARHVENARCGRYE